MPIPQYAYTVSDRKIDSGKAWEWGVLHLLWYSHSLAFPLSNFWLLAECKHRQFNVYLHESYKGWRGPKRSFVVMVCIRSCIVKSTWEWRQCVWSPLIHTMYFSPPFVTDNEWRKPLWFSEECRNDVIVEVEWISWRAWSTSVIAYIFPSSLHT